MADTVGHGHAPAPIAVMAATRRKKSSSLESLVKAAE
jgi:hypothetical protein